MKNTSWRRVPLINERIKDDTDHSEQDLILFKELHKREKERNIVNLLQPVSEEFEPNGNHQLYRIASAKKGSGFELLAENDKNDYDWLKTPPATPLFPSLEMDANSPELITQREIPILQPLSRFAAANCKSVAADKQSNGKLKSGNPKSKPPQRSVTPSTQRRSTIISSSVNQTKFTKVAQVIKTDVPILNQQKAIKSAADHDDMMIITRKTKPTTTHRSGVVSPLPQVRSTNNIADGFSNEKPSNLRTEQRSISATRQKRSISATRDRSGRAKSDAAPISTQLQRSACTAEPRRPQSCSSIVSISRGRKVVGSNIEGSMQLDIKYCTVNEGDLINTCTPRVIRSNQSGNGGQVLGSRMVQRVVSARSKVATSEEKTKKPNSRFPLNETSGFGRMIPKNSMDTTLKHMHTFTLSSVREGNSTAMKELEARHLKRCCHERLLGIEVVKEVCEVGEDLSVLGNLIARGH